MKTGKPRPASVKPTRAKPSKAGVPVKVRRVHGEEIHEICQTQSNHRRKSSRKIQLQDDRTDNAVCPVMSTTREASVSENNDDQRSGKQYDGDESACGSDLGQTTLQQKDEPAQDRTHENVAALGTDAHVCHPTLLVNVVEHNSRYEGRGCEQHCGRCTREGKFF